ncbi:IS200/IS605 family transposase [Patescibacteria group bacterium]|nr:IS200/IS605 family transposase [Patescibacteria group bacterium]MBU1890862.1 IS200/IS605 family transposase [Patescibacteria group bacterium]
MSQPIKKSHNVSQLLYHLVCPAKYRRLVFDEFKDIEQEMKDICLEIQKRYDIHFVEIGTDKDHVHFLIQSVPMISPKYVTQIVKSITAREIFKRKPQVKKMLWGGQFWTKGYYINTVGAKGNEEAIKNYVQNQGLKYQQIYSNQLRLFEG